VHCAQQREVLAPPQMYGAPPPPPQAPPTANPPLAPNQIDINADPQVCCEDPGWLTFKSAEHNMPQQLTTVMTQPEYSAIIAGVNAAIDEGRTLCGLLWTPAMFWLSPISPIC
jgi:hypothetical protein